ncbi:hypothetical protein [Roseixanthobacter pseudopolyaromaticivorans]|uniref:hypothetical protein n=1 Tax=Xanthobacteraceae TaxID=335928 RepID=UPI003726FCAE
MQRHAKTSALRPFSHFGIIQLKDEDANATRHSRLKIGASSATVDATDCYWRNDLTQWVRYG